MLAWWFAKKGAEMADSAGKGKIQAEEDIEEDGHTIHIDYDFDNLSSEEAEPVADAIRSGEAAAAAGANAQKPGCKSCGA